MGWSIESFETVGGALIYAGLSLLLFWEAMI